MKKVIVILATTMSLANTTQALEFPFFSAADSSRPGRRHAPPAREQASSDSTMQAVCREILVDTDEGYGITNQESRIICDEMR